MAPKPTTPISGSKESRGGEGRVGSGTSSEPSQTRRLSGTNVSRGQESVQDVSGRFGVQGNGCPATGGEPSGTHLGDGYTNHRGRF